MDFFAAQELSRRRSRRLMALFVLATAIIVLAVTAVLAVVVAAGQNSLQWLLGDPLYWARENLGTLITVAAATLALVLVASLYRTSRLASGGGEVARALGGTEVPPDVTDPLRRRLRNVVEEMALASGVPVPEVYVLENEPGINAFAAGFTPSDAAVAVTRGALEQLDRDELQGVVAHEFSHILNGDMRLNIRLMGLLYGILVIGLMGRMMLHGGRFGALRVGHSRRGGGNGGGVLLVLAAGLMLLLIGSIGVLFGRLIRAGVSRQREYLADASAVQFTRSNRGIAGALKKIGGWQAGSHLAATDGEEVSHMLFARGALSFRGMFATHPPLEQRIAALDRSFDADRARAARQRTPAAAGRTAAEAAGVSALTAGAGRVDTAQVARARAVLASLPPDVDDAAHSRDSAPLLMFALMLHRDPGVRRQQLTLLAQQLGERRAGRVTELADSLRDHGDEQRLMLLELAFPACKERPGSEIAFHRSLLQRLAESSGGVELFEYCLLRLLDHYLEDAANPSRAEPRRPGNRAGRQAVARLLATLAVKGAGGDAEAARGAYEAARRAWASRTGEVVASALPDFPTVTDWQTTLDHTLPVAAGLPAALRRATVAGVAAAVAHDGRLASAEAALARVICAVLDVPLPPVFPEEPPAATDAGKEGWARPRQQVT